MNFTFKEKYEEAKSLLFSPDVEAHYRNLVNQKISYNYQYLCRNNKQRLKDRHEWFFLCVWKIITDFSKTIEFQDDLMRDMYVLENTELLTEKLSYDDPTEGLNRLSELLPMFYELYPNDHINKILFILKYNLYSTYIIKPEIKTTKVEVNGDETITTTIITKAIKPIIKGSKNMMKASDYIMY